MKVKDLRLHVFVWNETIEVQDQDKHLVLRMHSGRYTGRTKPQAIAIANRLCDRFNAKQEGK